MELKTTELRLGNIVEHKSYLGCGHYGMPWVKCEIYELGETDNLSWINDLGTGHYRPITLTEELLVKLGFEKHEDVFIKIADDEHDSEFIIVYDEKLKLFKCAFSGFWYEIKTVHQLQNLYFALTKEELTLKDQIT